MADLGALILVPYPLCSPDLKRRTSNLILDAKNDMAKASASFDSVGQPTLEIRESLIRPKGSN
jgi:hypothetical protein